MQQNIFINVLYNVLYRGLLADTQRNPVNSLIGILSEDYLRFNPDFEQSIAPLVTQLRQQKNHFIAHEKLSEILGIIAPHYVEKYGVSIDRVTSYLEHHVFHYSTFIEDYNLLLCRYALMILDLEDYFIIVDHVDFNRDLRQALLDHMNDQVMRKRKAFDEFLIAESSKLSEDEKLKNKGYWTE